MIRKILAFSGLTALSITLAFFCMRTAGVGAAQEKKLDLTEAKYYGAATCYKCHADSVDGKPGKWSNEFVRMDEFTIWRTKDKHSLAYAVLEGPRGQQIGRILEIDATKAPQCLNCHATTARIERKGKAFTHLDGVSCDGCHGPAQHWIIDHALEPDTWRLKTPKEKEDLGMFDVRNPIKRAQLCASCHVGSAAEGKIVTHAMFAAGHPPLPGFEVAAFSKNLPQHWYDASQVPFFKKADEKIRAQNYAADAQFQHTKLVLASSSESMRAMLELIANRATHDGKPRDPASAWPPPWLRPYAKNQPADRWPELARPTNEPDAAELGNLWPEIAMAHSDCFACHHDLKSKSWRQLRGYTGKPGRPSIAAWPFVLAPIAILDDKESAVKLQKLASVLDETPFGQPKQLANAALDFESITKKMLKPATRIDLSYNKKLLKSLLALGTTGFKDYDSARQIAWATRTVYLESQPSHSDAPTVEKVFKQMDDELNLTNHSAARAPFVKARYELIAGYAKMEADFAAVVKTKPFLHALQKISDDELAASLSCINDYKPDEFKRHMENLRRLIDLK